MPQSLADVQSTRDTRRLTIDKVGIKGVRYPIVVLDKAKGRQSTVGEFSLSVDLPEEYRGTHMSRFVEVLERHKARISLRNFREICAEIKDVLHASEAHVAVAFPYFIDKRAPVSGAEGLMSYACSVEASLNDVFDMVVGVKAPVQTLCPCSKELARVSAHMQRGEVTLRFRYSEFVWLEDMIELVESCASSPVYAVLHDADAEALSSRAFDHPAFVEDVVRDVAARLLEHPSITWFSVECENFESIHNHSAYAKIERRKI